MSDRASLDKRIEVVDLEWFEATKKVMRKRTRNNQEVVIKMLYEGGGRLQEGDILFEDSHHAVVVEILPCEALEIAPRSLYEMGALCYEIGNKHLPLFIQNDKVLVPYEKPLKYLLQASGYEVNQVWCKLTTMLKANAEPHPHNALRGTLVSKIMDLARHEQK